MTIYRHHNEALAYNGMSLRDWFAASVISDISSQTRWTAEGRQLAAQHAYAMADAMLAARTTPQVTRHDDKTATDGGA